MVSPTPGRPSGTTGERRRAWRNRARPQGRRATIGRGSTACLLSEALEQRRHVNLVGLVVAGERVHDEIDAAAQGIFPLARIAADDRIERLAPAPHRPGGGEIVRADDDR